MRAPDGAHTHGGSGFDPMPVVIVIGAIAVASGVASAVAELAWLLLMTLSVAVLAGSVTTVLVVRHRLAHPQPPRGLLVQRYQPPPRPVQAPRAAPAIEAPPQNHVHFHGVSPEDVAAILRQQGGDR